MKLNEIVVLWSDYLHKMNPQTLFLKVAADFFVCVKPTFIEKSIFRGCNEVFCMDCVSLNFSVVFVNRLQSTLLHLR